MYFKISNNKIVTSATLALPKLSFLAGHFLEIWTQVKVIVFKKDPVNSFPRRIFCTFFFNSTFWTLAAFAELAFVTGCLVLIFNTMSFGCLS